jgi:hypothetical protein
MAWQRFRVPDADNAIPKHGNSGGRPGIGKDGAAGVRVQVIMPQELVDLLDAWAAMRSMGRGPALRRIAEGFFAPISNTYLTVVCRLCGGRMLDESADRVVNVAAYCSRPECIAADNARYQALLAERNRI